MLFDLGSRVILVMVINLGRSKRLSHFLGILRERFVEEIDAHLALSSQIILKHIPSRVRRRKSARIKEVTLCSERVVDLVPTKGNHDVAQLYDRVGVQIVRVRRSADCRDRCDFFFSCHRSSLVDLSRLYQSYDSVLFRRRGVRPASFARCKKLSAIEGKRMDAELIAKLAELEHEQWLSWARAVWDEVSVERREKWSPSMVSYADLSETAKEQDREWARKAAAIIGS